MENLITSQELEDSIERLTAGSVVSRMFYEIDRIAEPTELDENWLIQMLDVIRFSQEIETGFGHTKAYALAIIRKHWDDLPFDARRTYGFDFMTFARNVTGKEKSTILNYITTAKVWFIEKTKPDTTLSLKLRDVTGKPVLNDKTGEPRTRTVEFDPYMIDLSKLLLVNSTAGRGAMTPKLWEMLADSFYTCDDIKKELAAEPHEESHFYFFVEGAGLFLRNGPHVICIAEELNWAAYDTDSFTKEGMDKFFALLSINPHADEDGIYKENRKMLA